MLSNRAPRLANAYLCRRTATITPKFSMRRKCAGIPIAAKITPIVRPAVVRGTGAPKPVKFKNTIEISREDTRQFLKYKKE